MSIILNGTTGITTPDITSSGSLNIDASAPDDSLVVNSSGNVGIGTSSPGYRLEVVKSNPSSTGAIARFFHGPASNRSIEFGVADSGSFPTYIQSRGVGSATVDLSLQQDGGNLLVGTTSVISLGKISTAFDGSVAYGATYKTTYGFLGSTFVAFVNSAGSVQGSIYANATSSVQYLTSSDYRLKENIAPMTGALAKVSALKPVTYNWKVDGSSSQGFIAHELAEVSPECVGGEKDAVDADGNPKYQGVDTSFLVATLTAAIQEQQVLITQQAAAIDDLTARVSALEAK